MCQVTVNSEDSLALLPNCVCQTDQKATRVFLKKSIFVFYTALNADPIIIVEEWFVSFVLFQGKKVSRLSRRWLVFSVYDRISNCTYILTAL